MKPKRRLSMSSKKARVAYLQVTAVLDTFFDGLVETIKNTRNMIKVGVASGIEDEGTDEKKDADTPAE
jgi:hypothetical protein